LKDSVETVEIETANEIVTSEVFEIGNIRSLGIVKENLMPIRYPIAVGLENPAGTKFPILRFS
jgi:hypothetical protein